MEKKILQKEGEDEECLESEASAFQKFLHIFLFFFQFLILSTQERCS